MHDIMKEFILLTNILKIDHGDDHDVDVVVYVIAYIQAQTDPPEFRKMGPL